MHMADALVAPAVAGTMYVCSAAAAAYSVKKVRLENDPKKILKGERYVNYKADNHGRYARV